LQISFLRSQGLHARPAERGGVAAEGQHLVGHEEASGRDEPFQGGSRSCSPPIRDTQGNIVTVNQIICVSQICKNSLSK